MTKQQWVRTIVSLVLVFTVVLAGCSSKSNMNTSANNNADKSSPTSDTGQNNGKTSGESPSSGVTKQVEFKNGDWPQPNDKAIPQFEKWKTQLESENPNIKMKIDAYQYDTNTFLPKAESGQLPNIFATWFTEPVKIIKAGYASDITAAMTKYGYDKAINPSMLELVTQGGKIYGVPTSGYYMGMWYNINLFKKAGLLDDKGVPKLPKTYEEMAATAKIIKEKTGKAGFFFPTKNNQGGWQFMNIAWSYGSEFEQQAEGKWKAVFNSPESIEALQFVKDLKWKYNVLTDNILVDVNDMFRMFGTDQVGMAFGTSDWMNNPINDYKMSKDNLAMSAVPGGPKARIALTGGGLLMFANNSTPEQIDAGFKWMKVKGFSPDSDEATLKAQEESMVNDQKLNRIVGPHGMRNWINPEKVEKEQALYDKYKNVNLNLWNDYMENTGVTIHPEVPVNAQELYKTLDAVIQAVLTDKKADPKALLDKAVADFQRDYLDKAK